MPFISISDLSLISVYIYIYIYYIIQAALIHYICICILRFRPASTKMILSLRVLNRRFYFRTESSGSAQRWAKNLGHLVQLCTGYKVPGTARQNGSNVRPDAAAPVALSLVPYIRT